MIIDDTNTKITDTQIYPMEQEEQTAEEKDNLLIQRSYRKLLQAIWNNMDALDKQNVRVAFDLAVEAHKEQRRKTGEPYILHPLEVARICVEEIGLGPTAVICAILHDVVEDTDVTLEELQEKFGERGAQIAKIVDGLTKLDIKHYEHNRQAANFRKVLTTLTEDVRVVLIKMADRLHNMRTLGAMPRQKQLRIASETSYIYAPLAHRLGLYAFKTEFEDLCMKITEPEAYRYIAQKLNETKRARIEYINRFVEPLQVQLDEHHIKYRITGRPKSIASIWNKIQKKNVVFEQIFDLFAVRIIVDVPPKAEKQTCWHVYAIVSDVYQPIPERLKDWIGNPKTNGYESLHTTVNGPNGQFVEVQIRTERMNEIAERGFAAHWKYKGIVPQPNVYNLWLDSIRDLLDNDDLDALEFVHDFKQHLFKDEVFVFTPAGDMLTFPKGATVLDFAFHIHSDVGYHCTAAKIDGHITKMGTPLKSGDQIEVITDSKQKPKQEWLGMVATSRAKNHIRQALKEEKKEIAAFGREALERKLGHLKVDFEESINFLVKHYGYKSRLELFYDIAKEVRTVASIFRECTADGNSLKVKQEEKTPPQQPIPVHDPSKLHLRTSKSGLLINGEPAEIYQYQLASCCNPVQGEEIFAFLTANAGLKIHSTKCSNAQHLFANYGYRIMNAEWITTSDSSFSVDLIITGIDNGPGVIEGLTREISALNLNIRALNINGDQGYFKANLTLLVANKDQLHLAIVALKELDNVSTVHRMK